MGRRGKRHIQSLCVAAVTAVVAAGSASAGIVDGDYWLHNHPAGLQSPPPYGLRLDALNGDIASVFTFDFDYETDNRMAFVQMSVDQVGQQIHIQGDFYGGLNDPANTDNYADASSGQVGWWHPLKP